MSFLKDRIIVYPSFFVLFGVVVALGFLEQFFIIFIAVTLHEMAHVYVAFLFKLKIKQIIITPLGETSIIEKTGGVHFCKRLAVLIAGPFSNLICALIALLFFDKADFFINVNMAIGIFNILPIYPLDGGKIVHIILSRYLGFLPAGRIMTKMSVLMSYMLIGAGLVQVTLFPYNMSLLCVGVYILKINKKEYANIVFEFYKTLLSYGDTEKSFMPIRFFAICKTLKLKEVLNKMNFDYYTVVNVIEKGETVYSFNQGELIEAVLHGGYNMTSEELIQEKGGN